MEKLLKKNLKTKKVKTNHGESENHCAVTDSHIAIPPKRETAARILLVLRVLMAFAIVACRAAAALVMKETLLLHGATLYEKRRDEFSREEKSRKEYNRVEQSRVEERRVDSSTEK